MWWAIAVTIAALMAWVAWYEREQRREFQRMMKQHNIQVREMNGNYRPLENDFVHLEGRVDDLAEDVRELQRARLDVVHVQEADRGEIKERLDAYFRDPLNDPKVLMDYLKYGYKALEKPNDEGLD